MRDVKAPGTSDTIFLWLVLPPSGLAPHLHLPLLVMESMQMPWGFHQCYPLHSRALHNVICLAAPHQADLLLHRMV